jgi:hypothetical protein
MLFSKLDVGTCVDVNDTLPVPFVCPSGTCVRLLSQLKHRGA